MSVDENSFEIGLVMAGAISAGAYSAGVVDFLLEALHNYEKIRKKFAEEHPDAPPLHAVTIPVISGASAGGMTGTMLLSAMTDETYRPLAGFDPDTLTPEAIEHNVFYRSWVDTERGVDIDYLLDTGDLQKGKPLKSLLNCSRLEQIAENALSHPRALQPNEYIPKRIDLFLSATNLDGVPYNIRFQGSKDSYGMTMHSDMMHFVISREPVAHEPNDILLKASPDTVLNGTWLTLKQSSLATGAFPIALEARELEKERAGYDFWRWWVPQWKPDPDPKKQEKTKSCCENDGRCFDLMTIPPTWECRPRRAYRFLSVDGGVTNNEPLEIARRTLAGEKRFNPRDKNKADKAVLMIDPFPAVAGSSRCDDEPNTLISTALRLFGTLKSQARFKPGELELAANPDIFSRFLIAPSRDNAPVGQELAGASLGAFGGFLSEKFRRHDFQLGRKNCQSFLSRYFVIGQKNPLVAKHYEWFKDNGCTVPGKDGEYVQIIPMIGDITKPVKPIGYDTIKMTPDELDAIVSKISRRMKRAFDVSNLIGSLLESIARMITRYGLFQWIIKKILGIFKRPIRNALVKKGADMIKTAITSDLKDRNLLKENHT